MPARIENLSLPNPSREKRRSAVGLHNLFVRFAPNPAEVPTPKRIEREMRDLAALTRDTRMQELVGDCVDTALGPNAKTGSLQYVHEINSVNTPFTALRKEVKERWTQKPQVLTTMVDTLTNLRDQGQMDPRAVEQTKTLLTAFTQTMLQHEPKMIHSEMTPLTDDPEPDTRMLQRSRFFSPFIGMFPTSGPVITDTIGVHREGARIELAHGPNADVAYLQEIDLTQTAAETLIPIETGDINYAVTLMVQENGVWRKVQLAPPLDEADYDPARNVPSQKEGMWTADLPKGKSRYAIVVQSTPWVRESEVTAHQDTGIRAMFANREDERIFLQVLDGKVSDHFIKVSNDDSAVRIGGWDAKKMITYLEENNLNEVLNIPILGETVGEDSYAQAALNFSVRVGALGSKDLVPLSALIRPKSDGDELRQGVSAPEERGSDDSPTQFSKKERTDQEQILEVLGVQPEDESAVFIYATSQTHFAPEPNMVDMNRDYTETTRHTRDIYLQPLSHHESITEDRGHGNKVQVQPFLGVKKLQRETSEISDLSTLGDLLYHISFSDYPNPDKLVPVQINAPEIRAALNREERLRQERLERMRNQERLLGGGPRLIGGSDLIYRSSGYGDASTIFGLRMSQGDSRVGSSSVAAELPPTEIGTVAELTPHKTPKRKRRKLHELVAV